MTKREQVLTRTATFANLVLVAGGVVAAFVLFYFIYYYSWSGGRQFTSLAGALFYNIVPAAGVSGFVFAFLVMQTAFKIRLAAFYLALVASMFGAELFLKISNIESVSANLPFWGIDGASDYKWEAVIELAQRLGIKIDTRNHSEVVADLHKRGIDAVPIVLPGTNLLINQPDGSTKSAINVAGSELIPVGAIANKVTVLCNESGDFVSYKSDEHGFHNPGRLWNSSHVDIAALGESFVQGYCVPSGKSFVDLIRQRYPGTLNLGMSGQSSLIKLAVINEYLLRVRPAIVLWFYCEGIDVYDLVAEAKNSLLMRYLKPTFNQRLLGRQSEIDRELIRYSTETERRTWAPRSISRGKRLLNDSLEIIKLSELRQKLGLVYGITSDAAEAEVSLAKNGIYEKILLQAKARTRSWGGKLYFVYLPSWNRYSNEGSGAVAERARVLTLVQTLGIPIIDAHPAFQAQSDPLSLFPFRRFGHYNEHGHRLVAQEVLKGISARNPNSF